MFETDMDIEIGLHAIVVQQSVIHVEKEHGVIFHFFLPDLRALAKYGDICGNNAKHRDGGEAPGPAQTARTADQTPLHPG
jgi:hypothetical protein